MNNQPNPDYRPRRGREAFNPDQANEVGMMPMVKRCFERYADFSGRARRSEYWYFYLFNLIIIIPLYMLLFVASASDSAQGFVIILSLLWLLYALVSFIPSLASVVRRLHDTGKSGWNYLLVLIPIVGPIILIVYMAEDSQVGPNKWGENPKRIGNKSFKDTDFDEKLGF